MQKLDSQMRRWSSCLRDDLGIDPAASNHLATTISDEVGQLPEEIKERIKTLSPVPLSDRLDELSAFQSWMDFVHSISFPQPEVVRAQIIVQNYICFVYLKETWFEVLHDYLPKGSTTSQCCAFLLSDPIRSLRNAISQGNWRYKDDFSGIEYWNRKNKSSSFIHWEVGQVELDFWQALARSTAYATLLSLR